MLTNIREYSVRQASLVIIVISVVIATLVSLLVSNKFGAPIRLLTPVDVMLGIIAFDMWALMQAWRRNFYCRIHYGDANRCPVSSELFGFLVFALLLHLCGLLVTMALAIGYVDQDNILGNVPQLSAFLAFAVNHYGKDL